MTTQDRSRLFGDFMSSIQFAMYILELEDPDDPAGMRLVFANPATAELWRVPMDQIVGRTIREVRGDRLDVVRLAVYAEVAQGGPARDLGDIVFGPPTSDAPMFAVRVFPLPHRRVGVVCIEVTAQRAAELRATQVLDSMSDAFFAFDDEWRYTAINRAAERLTGRSRDELLGRTIWDVFPAVMSLDFFDLMQRVALDRVPATSEQHFSQLGMWVTLQIYPTPGGIAMFAQDVTERRKLEERLRTSQKLEAVSTLAGGIAHDFNNALTAIRAAAMLALDEMGETAAREDVERIDAIAEHASTLTRQLLTISRARTEKVEPSDLDTVVGTTADVIGALLGEAIELHVDLGAPDCAVNVNAAQLQQVILNLALNARDAMPSGGELAIRTFVERADDLNAARDARGPGVVLEVSDSGVGMDDETRRRAFDPFFTTKPQGTGLGLASVDGIVAQAGGRIDVRTQPDVGTTIALTLGTVDSTPHPPPNRSVGSAAERDGQTILVVEDDDRVLPLLVRSLVRLGYTVLSAASAGQALALVERTESSIDLLLTDVVMPGMGGGELAARLRSRYPDLRVLFISGHPTDELVRRGVQDDTASFLQKPFRTDALARSVRDALDSAAQVT